MEDEPPEKEDILPENDSFDALEASVNYDH